jgi:hypothetical protein
MGGWRATRTEISAEPGASTALRTLYVNSVTAGKLIRLDLGPDGKSTKATELTLSGPLGAPDGLRAIGKNKFVQSENGNTARAGEHG